MSDHIAMLHRGRLVLCGPIDEIKSQYRRITLCFDTPQSKPPAIPGAVSISGAGKEWTLICNGARAELPAIAATIGGRIVDDRGPSLNEIFVAHAVGPLRGPAAAVESLI